MKTIDITPEWGGLLPMLVEVAVNGETLKGRAEAMGHLRSLAEAADAQNVRARVGKRARAVLEGPHMREAWIALREAGGFGSALVELWKVADSPHRDMLAHAFGAVIMARVSQFEEPQA